MHIISLDYSLDTVTHDALLAISLATIFFSVYWFVGHSKGIVNRLTSGLNTDEKSIRSVLFSKYLGLISMGLLPVVLYATFASEFEFSRIGLTLNPETTPASLVYFFALAVLIVPIAIKNAKNPNTWAQYPQIRAKKWNPSLKRRHALGWIAYLFGYEILFRGILLFPVFDAWGLWPAVVINASLYSATHIPKGLGETVGAAPLGIVLSIISLQTGTIWTAFAIHCVMALTNAFTSLKYNPEMESVD